jgi:hypothetical protein
MIENKLFDQAFYSAEKFHHFEHMCINDRKGSFEEVTRQLCPIKHKFPLRLNITESRPNPIDLLYEDIFYHENSYFSLVTETQFYEDMVAYDHTPKSYQFYYGLRSAFLTEKTFRPIAFKHPFILCSEPFILQELKKLGYKTFHPYINETYDTIENDDRRLNAIITEVERLCSFTDEQWLEWQKNIKDIVEHNYAILLNKQLKDTAITKNVSDLFRD